MYMTVGSISGLTVHILSPFHLLGISVVLIVMNSVYFTY